MTDSYRHKGLRRQMIEELRAKGIADEAVLEAMDTLPRHFFLDSAFDVWAYSDNAFPIGNNQTISQPYTVAYMTALLDVKQGDKILEIGTGSGYQGAVLALLGARVYTIERQEFLYKRTKDFLKKLGFKTVKCFFGDGTQGLAEFAPYDKMMVTAGSNSVPKILLSQLNINGILVMPIGDSKSQVMRKITRTGDHTFETIELENFRFVPFLKGVNKI